MHHFLNFISMDANERIAALLCELQGPMLRMERQIEELTKKVARQDELEHTIAELTARAEKSEQLFRELVKIYEADVYTLRALQGHFRFINPWSTHVGAEFPKTPIHLFIRFEYRSMWLGYDLKKSANESRWQESWASKTEEEKAYYQEKLEYFNETHSHVQEQRIKLLCESM